MWQQPVVARSFRAVIGSDTTEAARRVVDRVLADAG
jgi:hypothetical protein